MAGNLLNRPENEWLGHIDLGEHIAQGLEGSVSMLKLALKQYNSSFASGGKIYMIDNIHIRYSFEIQKALAEIGLAPKMYAYHASYPYRTLMEFIDGKSFAEYKNEAKKSTGRFVVKEADKSAKAEKWREYYKIVSQLMVALRTMHKAGIYNLDQHAQNVLIGNKDLKPYFIDFSNLIREIYRWDASPADIEDNHQTLIFKSEEEIENYASAIIHHTNSPIPSYLVYRRLEKSVLDQYKHLVYLPTSIYFELPDGKEVNFIDQLFLDKSAQENWSAYLFYTLIALEKENDNTDLMKCINLRKVLEVCTDECTEYVLRIIIEVYIKHKKLSPAMRQLLRTLFYALPPRPEIKYEGIDFETIEKRKSSKDGNKFVRKENFDPLSSIWYEGLHVELLKALLNLKYDYTKKHFDREEKVGDIVSTSSYEIIENLVRKIYVLIFGPTKKRQKEDESVFDAYEEPNKSLKESSAVTRYSGETYVPLSHSAASGGSSPPLPNDLPPTPPGMLGTGIDSGVLKSSQGYMLSPGVV